jgi:hypothetical protein
MCIAKALPRRDAGKDETDGGGAEIRIGRIPGLFPEITGVPATAQCEPAVAMAGKITLDIIVKKIERMANSSMNRGDHPLWNCEWPDFNYEKFRKYCAN